MPLDYETPKEPDGSDEVAPILRFLLGMVPPLALMVPIAAVTHMPWDVIAWVLGGLCLLVLFSGYAFRNAFFRRQRRHPYLEERNAALTIVCGAVTPVFWVLVPIAFLFFIPKLPQIVPSVPLQFLLALPFNLFWPLVAPWVVFRGGRR